jgi:hypothetical protein
MAQKGEPSPATVPSRADVLSTSFCSWYQPFRDAKATIRGTQFELSPAFVAYLKADGVVMPRFTCTKVTQSKLSDDSDVDWSDDDEVADDAPSFPELEKQVQDAIVELGGCVFVKLNWSSPKDAKWMQGTLKCYSFEDICLLLKSSDFVGHDLEHAFDCCSPQGYPPDFKFTLVLKKWCNLNPAMEFRCFVYNGDFVGACQRDYSVHYAFLMEETMQLEIKTCLHKFFSSQISGKIQLKSFVFDAYIGTLQCPFAFLALTFCCWSSLRQEEKGVVA